MGSTTRSQLARAVQMLADPVRADGRIDVTLLPCSRSGASGRRGVVERFH